MAEGTIAFVCALLGLIILGSLFRDTNKKLNRKFVTNQVKDQVVIYCRKTNSITTVERKYLGLYKSIGYEYIGDL